MSNSILKALKYLRAIAPIILSVGLLLVLICTLIFKLNSTVNFTKILEDIRTDILTASGVLSGLIIAYLTSKVLQIRQEKLARLPQLNEQIQKLHKCRSIINTLLLSSLWVDGLIRFVEEKYQGLTHFDVRKTSIPGLKSTQQAQDFMEDYEFGDTAKLYLELKSFIPNKSYDQTLYTEFDVPGYYYNAKILQKWIDYDCGNGLYNYFGPNYSFYKDDLRLANVYLGDKKEIIEACQKIDQERYKGLDFGPELLSKLGAQLTADILPQLVRLQLFMEQGLPRIITYLFIVAGLLILFGVTLPLMTKLYRLPPIFDIVSISVTIAISFYLLISFYGFMRREIRLK